ncbi:hypothetical protein HC248_00284 [Polaromonas vacuolata]|uniref:Uncharacterized protein n=2 Tax=Polaromonas vacuolata TaxID=37448 RepID=A0A6H2H572_9BURK|nr:hypothetical protein HC248_00284 [Polaromonas vacuolata]
MLVGTPALTTHLLAGPKPHLMPIANFLTKCSIDAWPITDKVKLDADCPQRIHRPHKQRSKRFALIYGGSYHW